ncbi:hypothetical protein [Dysgonomonas termitidis]|uniref:Uncharacterized protein n=1 Tax=Dysgonomonas termitidis TaxID=1516126 RepID=A0ABV9KQL8_9BACT
MLTKTPKSKPLADNKALRFRAMIAYIHSYFAFVGEMQAKTDGLGEGDCFQVSRTKSPGCDTHIFTGNKYTVEITIRENS